MPKNDGIYHEVTDAPHITGMLNSIGEILGKSIRKIDSRYGFALVIYKKNTSEKHYISDAVRSDMAKTFKEIGEFIEEHEKS